ncbi:MAG TPA: DNA polymerase I [Polyangiaceae bacterium LLY-WYZ-15_(1-7)]|nr:DNA polymerase I [Myxococcales bacterium]MAT24545.1 DNA polymerase I [Sandaracinus sp.]HJK91684.1 DNA polymerase I [Polyangiaceae bacterium LLY-WYZ-15_(1-7)]MBJ71467.1 DNA polymerase I [Sandaracinus sp.]HJL03622.1 DNA polymerase I [Polyangiaceae bacterium LLY-WYZ-15_(1-7)]
MASRERVVLVDGSALIFRAFFAIPSGFQSSAGVPTNATYGFALMFRKILGGKTPAYGAVVFDAPGKTFRDAKYPKYKAQRPRMPGELREQLPWIRKVVEAHEWPELTVEGFEADDVIGTLARQAVEAGHEVFIVSGDKDFAQLVGEHVRMVDTMKDVTYDAELVRKKWGVPPERFVDYLALTGDKVDNVPGVPGVGPKTAKKLLEKYGDVEGVLAHVDEQKGKLKERLAEHAEDARLSKELVTIDTAVPLELGVEDLRVPEVDAARVDVLYRELEFFSLLSGDDAKEHAAEADFEALAPGEAAGYLAALGADGSETGIFVLHALPSPIEGALVGVAFSAARDEGRVARWLPLRGDGAADGAEEAEAFGALKAWAEDPARKKVTHDLRDVRCALEGAGIELRGVVGDTRLASFLIDPTKDIPHRLGQVARSWLHRTLIPLEEVVGRGKKRKALEEVPVTKLAPYAGQLAAAVAEAWPKLRDELEELGQTRYLEEISMPLAGVLARMQRLGIRADAEVLAGLGKEFGARKAEVEKAIWELAGKEFNVGSSKQLGEVLFDELGLPILKRTKTGYSTAADVLERLKEKHAIPGHVLRWRALAKLINTYTRVLREAIAEDGRIHCRFQQTAGASGRLITTDPDLQRTPIRTEDGARIREAFVPREGWVMISADWSQIELRLLAHVTGDEALLEAFASGVDVHARTASRIHEVDEAEVTAAQRNVGKTVNFATIYGQGATALGQSLGLPRKEAKALIERYFEVYAGVRTWLDEQVDEAYQLGYVETILGRRRVVHELSSNDPTERSYGERIATNTPIQGSAADICKLAMLEIDERLAAAGHEARMLLQIHDELLFECPPEEVEAVEGLVRAVMERPLERAGLELDVPLVVDIGHGESWAAAK